MTTDRRSPRWGTWMLVATLGVLPACAADPDERRDPAPPAEAGSPALHESRVGVPILMDLPILGFFFSRRTVVR